MASCVAAAALSASLVSRAAGPVGSSASRFNGSTRQFQSVARPAGDHGVMTMGATGRTREETNKYRGMSAEDIEKAVADTKMELFLLKVKQAGKQEVKPHMFNVLKKRIARMKTVKREAEVAEGIKPRESRRANKKKERETGGWWKIATIPEDMKSMRQDRE